MPHNLESRRCTYDALLDAVGHDGLVIEGGRRRYPTEVRATRGRLEFRPGSTGIRRPGLSREKVEAILRKFRETGSLRPVDYEEISSQAGYVLALMANVADRL